MKLYELKAEIGTLNGGFNGLKGIHMSYIIKWIQKNSSLLKVTIKEGSKYIKKYKNQRMSILSFFDQTV